MKRESIKIKANYPADISSYMNHLFDFFLDDITNLANQLYDDLLIKIKSNSAKYSFIDLEPAMIAELQSILSNYDRIINGFNFGGVFREYRTLEEDKEKFKINTDNKIKKLGKSFSYKYRDLIKKERQMNWTTITAIIGAIGTIITIITFILSLTTKKNQEIRLEHHERGYGFGRADAGLVMT